MLTRPILPVAALALLLPCVGLTQPPDEDRVLQDLLAKFEAQAKDTGPSHLKIVSHMTVNGQEQPEDTQDVWVRDATHLRADKSDGTIVVYSGNELKVFHGPSKVMLHVPPETFEALGDERDPLLGQIGVGPPTILFEAFSESRAGLSITGKETVGEADCWVVGVSPAMFDLWEGLLQNTTMGQEFTLRSLELLLENESARFRGITIDMSVETEDGQGAEVVVDQRVTEIEELDEVPDERLAFDEPDDTTTIVWTPDKLAWDVMPEFQQAIIEAMQLQAP